MPVLPSQGSAPYDTVDTVLNFARVIANDAELTIQGDLLADSSPEILPLLNIGWREFQDALDERGIEVLTKEIILSAFPPNLSNDPTSQAFVGFVQCFDGANYNRTPLLPPDLLEPLRLWERPTGQLGAFEPMGQASDGLPSRVATARLGLWDWRGDAIYFSGSVQPTDIRIRYSAYFPDFAPDPLTPGVFPASAPVPILRSAQALAYFVVAAFIRGRGADPDIRGEIDSKKEDALNKYVNRTARKKQRGNYRRKPYSHGNNPIYGW